jgi:hypothetical protein
VLALTLGLEELVDLGGGETSKELLGHGVEAGGAADELVRELGLVLRVVGVDVAARMSGARVRHEDTV